MHLELSEYIDQVRKQNPLIHHITNYVTVNDCANITLAIGASPVMADDPAEAADMTGISSALVVNIGTLNSRTVESMCLAGVKANEKGIPLIFDPVGCGAVPFRLQSAQKILKSARMSVVRGNISEIGALCGLDVRTRGVDADTSGAGDAAVLVPEAARKLGCIVAATGAVDVISDGKRTIAVQNGCSAMARITGSGCMCTSLVGSFAGANPDHLLEATTAAIICMGLCGEMAWEQAGTKGLGSFHMALIDAAGQMNGKTLEKGARYHEL